MDEMRSSEFRKRYATLTARTVVTVNGHVIGEWVPVRAPTYATMPERWWVADEDAIDHRLGTADQQAAATDRIARGAAGVTVLGGEPGRPFRPVPKPIRKAKGTR